MAREHFFRFDGSFVFQTLYQGVDCRKRIEILRNQILRSDGDVKRLIQLSHQHDNAQGVQNSVVNQMLLSLEVNTGTIFG